MKIKRKSYALIVCCLAVWFFLGACAADDLKIEPIATTENPTEQINRLENELSNARKNQVNVLSPTWFAKAESSYNAASQGLDAGTELLGIMDNVARGQAELKRAEETSEVARTTLPDVIKARDSARSAGATTLHEDYEKAEAQFIKLTKAIEDNDIEWAQDNRDKVAIDFRQLELEAIKSKTIGEVQQLIAQAESEGAKKLVPETLQSTQSQFKEVDKFISEHRYSKEEMQTKAADALFQAQRLVQLNKQSRTIQAMSPEKISLWIEEILYKVTDQLSAPDMRNETFDTQLENIIGSVSTLKKDQQFMITKANTQQSEIELLQKQVASLEGLTRQEQMEKERLAAETKFQQLFVEVQNFFEPEEAEVYKQGSQLVIRLRTIKFPVGSHVLMPDNYELLSKVQRAIHVFAQPDVVIEGHTDSTGSDAVNEHLSQKRAESVKQYLVANATLPVEKIVAVGYGSTKPLASNQTAEGRAINRRIDVIVIPETQTEL